MGRKTALPPESAAAQRKAKAATVAAAGKRAQRRRTLLRWTAAAAVAMLVIGGLYVVFRSNTQAAPAANSGPAYKVGSPGPGETAPGFTLPSTAGKQVSLSDYRGETTLLYVHAGGGCQACWDQITALENSSGKLRNAGVDELITITTDPTGIVAQKMADMGLNSTALSDPDRTMANRYGTLDYAMMEGRNGHTFILVSPQGRIQWRADYGGAPNYTMYVPIKQLLADLKAGRRT